MYSYVTNVLYIARILPYVSVYTHVTPTCACPLLIQVYVLVNMLLACTRMLLLHVYGVYWYVTHILLVCTHMYLNVTCMYSYATCMYSYVTHKYLCGVLVMIQLTMQLQTVVTVVKFGCMG